MLLEAATFVPVVRTFRIGSKLKAFTTVRRSKLMVGCEKMQRFAKYLAPLLPDA
jgi:hypothetical protein